MNRESQAICEKEFAVETCRNWESASIADLSEACRHIEGAVLLLILRMDASLT
jgi:hypothetical protein